METNRVKINIRDLGTSGGFVKIPISMDFITIDQTEVVMRDFVGIKKEEAINPIVDYEKVRFMPVNSTGGTIENIKYELDFLTGGTPTMYGDIGFTNEDIKFRRNNFVRSFLRLSFYDSDIATDQRLMSFVTIYSRVTKMDIIQSGDGMGLPLPATTFPVRFMLNNPLTKPDGFSEGYYLYHYKAEVPFAAPKYLYMKAEYNNAKTGLKTRFMTVNTPQSIEVLGSKLYTRYKLTRTSTGFYYEVDSSYSTNINYASDLDGDAVQDDVVVKLYEIQVL